VSATRVLVLRHGQSEWNASGRWQGQADPPLTALGLEQAHIAGRLLTTECPSFDAVVSSDLQRAVHTADAIAELVGCEVRVSDRDWRENDAGEWQGLMASEIREQWPGWLEAGRRPPGFETPTSTWSRASRALAAIHDRWPGGCVLVVSHGGVIRVMRQHLAGVDNRFPNLAGSWFESEPHPISPPQWRVGSLLFPLDLAADDLRNSGAPE